VSRNCWGQEEGRNQQNEDKGQIWGIRRACRKLREGGGRATGPDGVVKRSAGHQNDNGTKSGGVRQCKSRKAPKVKEGGISVAVTGLLHGIKAGCRRGKGNGYFGG